MRQTNLTRIDKVDNIFIKRDDTFEIAGVSGGKARTCWALAQGATGLVTAGSRHSPQVNIVSHIAKHLGIPCRVHVPQGEMTPELLDSEKAGATVIQHFPGYNSVICRRAMDDALEQKWTYIPFGMECEEAINQTASQTSIVPFEVKRIVIPVGSGMSYMGVRKGLYMNFNAIPVLGVRVGASPEKRFKKFEPNWPTHNIVTSSLPYEEYAHQTYLGDILLDPIYEAKCLEFLRPNDMLWIVGIRKTFKESNDT